MEPGTRCVDGVLYYSSSWLDQVTLPVHDAAERMGHLVRRLNGLDDGEDEELEELVEDRAKLDHVEPISPDAAVRLREAKDRLDLIIARVRKLQGQ